MTEEGERTKGGKGRKDRAGPAGYVGFFVLVIVASVAGYGVLSGFLRPSAIGPPPVPERKPPLVRKAAPTPDEASERCASCHEDHYRFWKYGGHASVACETCHGPAGDHVREEIENRPAMLLAGNEQCMGCHRRKADRAGDPVRTIESFEGHIRDIEEHHVIRVKRARERRECVYCHDPHLLQ